jgi:hypothetical protein
MKFIRFELLIAVSVQISVFLVVTAVDIRIERYRTSVDICFLRVHKFTKKLWELSTRPDSFVSQKDSYLTVNDSLLRKNLWVQES